MRKIERLDCKVKNYTWGKHGKESEVALLYAAGNKSAKIDNIPYAELWVGTHPDGPAKIFAKNVTLSEYMVDEGSKTNRHLPYIMKIMSISHNLSLQVHPTKEQAKLLNKKDPINYPDPNHKPELAYALTKFELLCGFRPADEIAFNMKAFPELCLAMGKENCALFIAANESNNPTTLSDLSQLLKRCFSCMMKQDKMFVRDIVECLINRIENGVHGCLTKETVKVLLNLYKRFPYDIACISPLILNHIILQPGECVFYGAQELHSYLSGECVECVSCSNNTIRAGLTTKFVDKDNLLKILNYRMAEPLSYYVLPRRLKSHQHILEFIPNCDDFMLQCLRIDQNDLLPLDLPALECPSTFIIVEAVEALCIEMNKNGATIGKQFRARRGDVFFIPPMSTLRFLSAKNSVYGYRTYSFERGPDDLLAKRLTTAAAASADQQQIPSTNGAGGGTGFLDKRPNGINNNNNNNNNNINNNHKSLARKFLEVQAAADN